VTAGRTRPAAIFWIGLGIAIGAVAFVVASVFGQPARQTETGLVTAVDAAGLTDVRDFTIRTDDGRMVVFRIGTLENGAQFPPGHLLAHRANGVKVVVTYRSENGALVAIRLDDAPGTGPPGSAVTAPT
jgi:hypothetical protein